MKATTGTPFTDNEELIASRRKYDKSWTLCDGAASASHRNELSVYSASNDVYHTRWELERNEFAVAREGEVIPGLIDELKVKLAESGTRLDELLAAGPGLRDTEIKLLFEAQRDNGDLTSLERQLGLGRDDYRIPA